jgi:hypothetical protein
MVVVVLDGVVDQETMKGEEMTDQLAGVTGTRISVSDGQCQAPVGPFSTKK